MAISNLEDYIWSLKCEIEKYMSVLIKNVNANFIPELPPAISASVCRKFLQCIFYICQEFLNLELNGEDRYKLMEIQLRCS